MPQRPDPKLPVKLKCAIADCITLYSEIESCIVEVVWTLEEADLKRKQEIAKGWGEQNFRIVKKAIKSIPGAQSDAIWPALKELGKERNLIGHGVWRIADDGRPLVVWHAKFLESDDWVTGEYFDWTRFDTLKSKTISSTTRSMRERELSTFCMVPPLLPQCGLLPVVQSFRLCPDMLRVSRIGDEAVGF
jgi:hypothetical protein